MIAIILPVKGWATSQEDLLEDLAEFRSDTLAHLDTNLEAAAEDLSDTVDFLNEVRKDASSSRSRKNLKTVIRQMNRLSRNIGIANNRKKREITQLFLQAESAIKNI